jgi:hypothetical protein
MNGRDVEQLISELLTRPQRAEIKRMTLCGYSKIGAIRRLLRLGILVRRRYDLEMDLTHGTNFVLPREGSFDV